MKKEINWDEVDKESKIYLQKYLNFEKDLKRIRQKNKSLKQMSKEVNDFCEKNNIETYNLEFENNNKIII